MRRTDEEANEVG